MQRKWFVSMPIVQTRPQSPQLFKLYPLWWCESSCRKGVCLWWAGMQRMPVWPLSPAVSSHSCGPSFVQRHQSDGSSHETRQWKRAHSQTGGHSCAPYLSFLTSRCFSWTTGPSRYWSPGNTVTSLSVLFYLSLKKQRQYQPPNISSVKMAVLSCYWPASRRLFDLQGGLIRHGERGLLEEFAWVRPTARLQFLNFFDPERVFLFLNTQDSLLYFLMLCSTFIDSPELALKTTNTLDFTAFVKGWESRHFAVVSQTFFNGSKPHLKTLCSQNPVL